MTRRKLLASIPSKPREELTRVSEPAQTVSIIPITFEWATSVGRQSVIYVERRLLN